MPLVFEEVIRMTSTISANGQLVIPAAVRQRYHLTPGSQIEILDTGQQIVLVPVPKDAFRASRGMLKGYSTKAFLAWRRQERRRDHEQLGSH